MLSTVNLNECITSSFDEAILNGWIKCAEYLLHKHNIESMVIKHKRLNDGYEEEFLISIIKRSSDVSKVSKSKQEHAIVEDAGIALGIMITEMIRPVIMFRVLNRYDGYDYGYFSDDNDEEEFLEVTGTEKPNEGIHRLHTKIRKFKEKFPQSAGYISVSCFCEKLLIYWGHKN